MSLITMYLLTEDTGFEAKAQELQIIKNTVLKFMASLLRRRTLALLSFPFHFFRFSLNVVIQ